MLVKLFGPSGAHFGWMLEGDVFDAEYQPRAFSDGDDLYSFSCTWLGTRDKFAVYDRQGGIASGRRAMRTLPSRLSRLSPRIGCSPSAVPEELRYLGITEGGSNISASFSCAVRDNYSRMSYGSIHIAY